MNEWLSYLGHLESPSLTSARPHTGGWKLKANKTKCAYAEACTRAQVCSAISALAFQAPSSGARNDLVGFLLINACFCRNKTRGLHGRKYEAPEAAKLWRQVISVILHTAPRSSLGL